MNHTYKIQQEADNPENIAKGILRVGDTATLRCMSRGSSEETTITVSYISDLSGVPILCLDEAVTSGVRSEELEVSNLEIGDNPKAFIRGRLEFIEDDARPFAEARFIGSNHKIPNGSSLVRYIPRDVIVSVDQQRHTVSGNDILTKTNQELRAYERRVVDHMNDDHADAIKLYAEKLLDEPPGNWRMATLDMEGMDLVSDEKRTRLWFNPPMTDSGEIKTRLIELVKEARG
ncbi:MAG: DUF2470 domain-containing protein [Pseudomonadota bacterium]